MRLLSLVIFLAACSSGSSASPDAATSSDGAAPLTCSTTIAAYCAANRCDQTLADAEDDRTLCPASLTVCGDYTVVTQNGVDTVTSLYYQADQLVAISHTTFPRGPGCLAGPATFSPPGCGTTSQQLPACSP